MKTRAAQSQWDFGELFPPEVTRRVFTVSELTVQVRRVLEKEIGRIWVSGEVSNLRFQSSGHCYFTLKDAAAQLSCVLFRGETGAGRAVLADGRKVILQGELSVYEPRGQYQLVVRVVEVQGVGALQLAFEKLKRQLEAEGLFAPERKRPLPDRPRRIGLATSPTGAALQDVLHTVQRRNPMLEIIFAPCRVQGDGAGAEVAAAIRSLNEFHAAQSSSGLTLDLILVTRGGGSLEDLWAFNEEVVARAIVDSAVPVVSAVGHEIDFTISDFVADVRAATPTAAAEIITEGIFSSREFISDASGLMRQSVLRRIELWREELETLEQRRARVHPLRRLNEQLQRLDDLRSGLLHVVKYRWRERRAAALMARQRLLSLRPRHQLDRRSATLDAVRHRLAERLREGLKDYRGRLEGVESRLRLLAPSSVLARGYSITMDAESGAIIRDAAEVRSGQLLKTQLKRGEVRSRKL